MTERQDHHIAHKKANRSITSAEAISDAKAMPSPSLEKITLSVGLATALVLFLLSLIDVLSEPDNQPAFISTLPNTTSKPLTPPALLQAQRLENAAQASVHGATLTPLAAPQSSGSPSAGWLAAWYGGTREGAKDVQLFLSKTIEQKTTQGTLAWQMPQAFLSRETLSEDLNRYIKKLGNPVLYTGPDQRVWLFFVSVSVGGWAGSAINVMTSNDGGQSFSAPRRLTTSPFFNVSTLVRNRPIALADGGMVVPIYHEFIGKFCELLWLDAQGNITDKQRLTWGRHTLQPSIVAQNEQEAAVFMRVSAPKTHIEVSVTENAGKHFSTPKAINLPNPNAAIDATLLPDNQWLLVYNHDPIGRDKLSLATAEQPLGPWQQRLMLDQRDNDKGFERFSYPVIVAANDQYHLLYTVERSFIKSVRFNAHWLELHGSTADD